MSTKLRVGKSIVGSIFFKLSSAVVSFISVPLLLKTLGTNDYAIWVTITAIVGWLNIFDFGSGYSLKNKVTEAYATNKKEELNVLIAGTLQFYLLVSFLILLVFIVSLFLVKIFATNIYLSIIIFVPIILAFPFTLGHFIIQGLRKFNLFNSILFAQSFLWLIIVMMFRHNFFQVNIYKLAYCYSGLFVVANLTIILCSLKTLAFDWRQVLNFQHFKSSKGSLLVGVRFFLLQICSLFIYSMGNMLTYSNLTLKNVAQYDTVNKIFLLGMTVFNVLISIFWTEISHAKALKQKDKLVKLFNQLLLCALLFSIGACVVTFLVPTLVSLWTNKNITISDVRVVYPFAILIIVQVFAYCGAVFLNAFEKLKGQIVLSVIAAVLMIPLSKLFFNLSVGIGSVPLASALLTFPTLIYVIYKSKKCISEV